MDGSRSGSVVVGSGVNPLAAAELASGSSARSESASATVSANGDGFPSPSSSRSGHTLTTELADSESSADAFESAECALPSGSGDHEEAGPGRTGAGSRSSGDTDGSGGGGGGGGGGESGGTRRRGRRGRVARGHGDAQAPQPSLASVQLPRPRTRARPVPASSVSASPAAKTAARGEAPGATHTFGGGEDPAGQQPVGAGVMPLWDVNGNDDVWSGGGGWPAQQFVGGDGGGAGWAFNGPPVGENGQGIELSQRVAQALLPERTVVDPPGRHSGHLAVVDGGAGGRRGGERMGDILGAGFPLPPSPGDTPNCCSVFPVDRVVRGYVPAADGQVAVREVRLSGASLAFDLLVQIYNVGNVDLFFGGAAAGLAMLPYGTVAVVGAGAMHASLGIGAQVAYRTGHRKVGRWLERGHRWWLPAVALSTVVGGLAGSKTAWQAADYTVRTAESWLLGEVFAGLASWGTRAIRHCWYKPKTTQVGPMVDIGDPEDPLPSLDADQRIRDGVPGTRLRNGEYISRTGVFLDRTAIFVARVAGAATARWAHQDLGGSALLKLGRWLSRAQWHCFPTFSCEGDASQAGTSSTTGGGGGNSGNCTTTGTTAGGNCTGTGGGGTGTGEGTTTPPPGGGSSSGSGSTTGGQPPPQCSDQSAYAWMSDSVWDDSANVQFRSLGGGGAGPACDYDPSLGDGYLDGTAIQLGAADTRGRVLEMTGQWFFRDGAPARTAPYAECAPGGAAEGFCEPVWGEGGALLAEGGTHGAFMHRAAGDLADALLGANGQLDDAFAQAHLGLPPGGASVWTQLSNGTQAAVGLVRDWVGHLVQGHYTKPPGGTVNGGGGLGPRFAQVPAAAAQAGAPWWTAGELAAPLGRVQSWISSIWAGGPGIPADG